MSPRLKTSPALTAAATKIDLTQREVGQKVRKRKQEWQKTAWDYYDEIGEVKYAASSFVGGALKKVRLFPAIKPDDEDDPIPADNDRADEVLARLKSDQSNQALIVSECGVNLMIAGECYLVGLDKGTTDKESWDIYSIDEIDGQGDEVFIKESESGNKRKLGDDDFFLRIWLKHPRWSAQADSPLRGVLSICEELLTIDRAIRAVAESRLAGAGILFIPSQMDFSDLALDTDPEGSYPFFQRFLESIVSAVQEPGSASAVAPFVVKADGELIDKVRYEKFERTFDDLERRTERALRRLAQGLNMPPEVILGLADINHWTAWQIDEGAFRTGVDPLLMEVVWALSSGFYEPMLKEEDVPNSADIFLGYDPSAATEKPVTADIAMDAHDKDLISDEAARRVTGFNEKDAPNDEEIAARTERRRAIRIRERDETPPGPPPQVRAAATSLGQQLVEIDRRLRERLHVAADMAIRRMLEKSGAKIVSKARRDKSMAEVLKGVDNIQVAATLGPATVKALGINIDQMVANAFDEVEAKWNRWVREAGLALLALIPGLTDTRGIEAQLDNLRIEGWRILEAELKEISKQRLFDPTPREPERGEGAAGEIVPMTPIRRAIAGAGSEDFGRAEFLGVATGLFAKGLFADQGVKTAGYRWDYGLEDRTPFPPHEELDGVEFASFEDEVLANNEAFPDTAYFFPGDHDFCRCSVIPIME